MKQDLNIKVSEALKEYAKEKELSQDQLSTVTGLNVSYINAILKKETHIGKTKIKDTYYLSIAKTIGLNLESKTYWQHQDTVQYQQIFTELLDAKVSGRPKMIIGATGCSKTYTVDRFLQQVPNETYKITLSSLFKLNDVLDELSDKFNIEHTYNKHNRLKKIGYRLWSKQIRGQQPVVIFDEAENATVPTLRMIKAFYDEAHPYCSIVLIGTPQLLKKLDKLREKDVDGMAQFYRRFKAGIREVKSISKSQDYKAFLDTVEDKHLRTLISTMSDNYGELNAYLEYALREADRSGVPLTERFFSSLFALD